jgi:pSer/pThr/pTyr-binding forkhead associated (FHA) protein
MKLTITEEGTRYELAPQRPVISVGRAIDNDIRLASTLVSRHHCRIEVGEEGTWVIDLGSANGTAVNGERIARRLLESGDTIQIGSVRIEVELATEDATPPASETQPIEPAPAEADGEPVGLRTLTGDGRRERDNLRVFARITR